LGDEIALLHCVAFFVAHACESTADAKRELDLTDVDVAVEREAVGAVARPHDEPSREAYGHDRRETEDHQHAFFVHRDGSACTIAAMLRRSCARMSASSDAPSSGHCISRMTHARAARNTTACPRMVNAVSLQSAADAPRFCARPTSSLTTPSIRCMKPS